MGPFDKKFKKFITNNIRVAPKVPSVNDKVGIDELKDFLSSKYPQTRKDAVRRVVEQMNLGKDMSSLFPDIVKNMGINNDDIELKKLIYLFIINYSLEKPEFMILVINSFLQDTLSDNPLIKCMALKTMCMLPIEMVLEYLEQPITDGLLSDNAYVRKTSVICLLKIYNYDLDLFEKLLPVFKGMMYKEDNSMVIGNILQFLMEMDSKKYLNITLTQYVNENIEKLVNILPECNEWSRVSVLNSLAIYDNQTLPLDPSSVYLLTNKVTPYLQHINPSIIMSALKVLFNFIDFIKDDSSVNIWEKLAMGIVSILNNPSFELQFILMRNLRIILSKLPTLYSYIDIKNFFLKMSDPIYLKYAKLEILDEVLNKNLRKVDVELVISEYKDYCNFEFNNEFIETVLNKLGDLLLLLDSEKDIHLKLNIIEFLTNDINYQNDAVMINLCKICNSYSRECQQLILTWCLSNWESLLFDRSKAHFINYITVLRNDVTSFNSILSAFIENISDEGPETQLMTINALIKTENLSALKQVLDLDVYSLEVKEMVTFYQRLFSNSNPSEALKFMNINQVSFNDADSLKDKIPANKLNYWFKNLGYLSSVLYHESEEDIPPRAKILYYKNNDNKEKIKADLLTLNDMIQKDSNELNLLDFEDNGNLQSTSAKDSKTDPIDDLLGLF
ncbi:uncharacterized protein HGUI_02699 [Hanseniaspora guilliermondii]|uniref:AP complex subunit beta n=1 Tax=Hanseniaspora guilliermondii TaxID=56406 RepID=A0A1L0B619_9ASCO|nr:uncharacterized protein HGUI_02699 [Hanseniaspora guilliermondii]